MGFLVSFRPAWEQWDGSYCGVEGQVLVIDLEESPLANQKRGGTYEGIGAAHVARLQGPDRTTSYLRRPTQARFIRMQAGASHSLGLLFLSGNGKVCQMLSVPEKGSMGSFQVTRGLHLVALPL